MSKHNRNDWLNPANPLSPLNPFFCVKTKLEADDCHPSAVISASDTTDITLPTFLMGGHLMATTQVMNGLPVDVIVSYCPAHPTVETQMRCNRCGRLICLHCAVQTPVGYRCKQCVTAQQAVYFTARPVDDLLVGLLSFVVALIVTPFVAMLGDLFWIGGIYVALLAGPGAGVLLTQMVRWVVKRRRSRIMDKVMTVGLLAGLSVIMLGDLIFVGTGLVGNLPLWVFVTLTITTAYRQLN